MQPTPAAVQRQRAACTILNRQRPEEPQGYSGGGPGWTVSIPHRKPALCLQGPSPCGRVATPRPSPGTIRPLSLLGTSRTRGSQIALTGACPVHTWLAPPSPSPAGSPPSGPFQQEAVPCGKPLPLCGARRPGSGDWPGLSPVPVSRCQGWVSWYPCLEPGTLPRQVHVPGRARG